MKAKKREEFLEHCEVVKDFCIYCKYGECSVANEHICKEKGDKYVQR